VSKNPYDLGSQIRFRIFPKKRTPNDNTLMFRLRVYKGSHILRQVGFLWDQLLQINNWLFRLNEHGDRSFFLYNFCVNIVSWVKKVWEFFGQEKNIAKNAYILITQRDENKTLKSGTII